MNRCYPQPGRKRGRVPRKVGKGFLTFYTDFIQQVLPQEVGTAQKREGGKACKDIGIGLCSCCEYKMVEGLWNTGIHTEGKMGGDFPWRRHPNPFNL